MNALYKSVIVATILSAIGFIPIMMAYDDGLFSFRELYLPALVGLAVTFLLVAITEYYTGTRWHRGQVDRVGFADRARDQHHRRPRLGHASHGGAGDRDRDRHPLGLLPGRRRRQTPRRACTASASRSWRSSR